MDYISPSWGAAVLRPYTSRVRLGGGMSDWGGDRGHAEACPYKFG
jgi:hypothetical protein